MSFCSHRSGLNLLPLPALICAGLLSGLIDRANFFMNYLATSVSSICMGIEILMCVVCIFKQPWDFLL